MGADISVNVLGVVITEQQAEILLSAADGGDVTIRRSSENGPYVSTGGRDGTDFIASDPKVQKDYLRAFEIIRSRGFVIHPPKVDNPDYYVLTKEALAMSRELSSTEKGKSLLENLKEKGLGGSFTR